MNAITTMSGDFTPEQKRYLEGFTSGLQAGRAVRAAVDGWRRAGARRASGGASRSGRGAPQGAGPLCSTKARSSPIRRSSSATLHPFDGYEKLKAQAVANEAPKPDDNFRWRFFGLFYCAPNQKSYMCRLRIPNGMLKHWQFAGLADLAERYAGGYAHVTTRANLQMREIEPQQRGRDGGGDPGPRPRLTRLRRRQHPQCHRHAHGRHRSAGTHRHPPLRARVAFSHPERSLALRHPAQVQCRVRRRRPHSSARGHQRYWLSSGRDRRWFRRRAGRVVSPHARRHHRSS